MITREDLLDRQHNLFMTALDVQRVKNADYARTDDPFENFRTFGSLGILVHISDKLARLRRFEESGEFALKEDTVENVVINLMNFAALYLFFKQDEDEKERAIEVLTEPVSIER